MIDKLIEKILQFFHIIKKDVEVSVDTKVADVKADVAKVEKKADAVVTAVKS